MRITGIILHSIFLILAGILLLKIPFIEQFRHTLFLCVVAYMLIILTFSVIKEIILFSFPRHIGILLAAYFFSIKLITKDFVLFQQETLIIMLTFFSLIIAAYFLFLQIINSSVKFSFSKIKTRSYRFYYVVNNVFYLLIITTGLSLFYYIAQENNDHWYYLLAILMALFPYFNKNYVRRFANGIKPIRDQFKLEFSFSQLGKMARIRNFVFTKEKLIESGDYHIIESDYRSTVRVITAGQLSLKLANEWNKKYAKLFVNDEYEEKVLKYDIVEQNENGICVIDDSASMYHFGTYAFVKDKIRSDNKSNLFLLKNDLPIAKFVVNEKISNEKVELINQLDYFGNTILFNHGIKEDLGRDYSIVFDRVYSGLTEEKKINLLKELNKKAPTAFFTAKSPKNVPCELSFYISSNIDIEKSEKVIISNSQSMLTIPALINFAKKVHRFIKYALLLSITIQLFLVVFALFNYKNMLLLLSLNLILAAVAELITKIFSKKIHQFPGQPANLAQSHQAA